MNAFVLYVSTSRKPSPAARRLARAVATFMGGEVENRGKRSVQDLVERAAAKGYSRLMLVYESHGNPSELAFLEEENWLGRILVSSVAFPTSSEGRIPQGTKPGGVADGEKGAAILGLFGLKPRRSPAIMTAGRDSFSFAVGGAHWGPVVGVSSVEVGADG